MPHIPSPPRHLKLPKGVWKAELSFDPPRFFTAKRPTRSRTYQLGLKYEQKVDEWLAGLYGPHYIPHPWFRYRASGANDWLWCQPDGILFDSDIRGAVIIETKWRHTQAAYWSLELKYRQVIGQAFPNFQLRTCEVCHWHDPSTKFPVQPQMVPSPELTHSDRFGLTIYKPGQ